jgi:hypothetical protein
MKLVKNFQAFQKSKFYYRATEYLPVGYTLDK